MTNQSISFWTALVSGILLATIVACSGADESTDDPYADPTDTTDTSDASDASDAADATDSSDASDTSDPSDVQEASPLTGKLFINEVSARGNPSDWIELYNGSDEAIDLTGITFSDDLTDGPSAGAPIPGSPTLEPGAFLQVFASDELSGFKLGGDEEVGLYDAEGLTIDSVDWDEGDASTDNPDEISFGRVPDGTGAFQSNTPTPGATNG
jgi:hypothetical protein